MSEVSTHSNNSCLQKLFKAIDKKFKSKEATLVKEFAERFFAATASEDLDSRSVEHLLGIVTSQWSLISDRKPGVLATRVFNPDFTKDGWQSEHTFVSMAYDDMPFLVDTILTEMNRQELSTHLVIHVGGLQLVRNDKHQVKQILAMGAYEEAARPEAVITIEMDRITDSQTIDLFESDIHRVLADVTLAVEDWKLMQQKLYDSLMNLEQNPPPLDPAEIAESKDFLRWLDCDHFTFLGCRDYKVEGKGDSKTLCSIPDTGLGVLRSQGDSCSTRRYSELTDEARELALSPQILIIAKTNTRSTVHRSVYTDFVGVKQFDDNGNLVGERRFIGLYTSMAYHSNPKHIPFLRQKVAKVMQMSCLTPYGHSGKALLHILETLPRDDLFQASAEELLALGTGILQLQERQQVRLFMRKDAYGRFYSCLVYAPREIFSTELRIRYEEVFEKFFDSRDISFATLFTESTLARIHFVIRVDSKIKLDVEQKTLEAALVETSRSWRDDFREELVKYYNESKGLNYYTQYKKAFPVSYQEYYSATAAVVDIEHIERLKDDDSLEMILSRPSYCTKNAMSFKLFRKNHTFPLSDVLPILEHLGLRVIGERPQEIKLSNGDYVWINDFYIEGEEEALKDIECIRPLFQEAFANVWSGRAESDGFDDLILKAKIASHHITMLRAYAKYLRQAGFTFSQSYIESVLADNPSIAQKLVSLFEARFNPALQDDKDSQKIIVEEIESSLEEVSNLDEDRILRRYLDVISASLRTNFYQLGSDGLPKDYLSIKFDPHKVPELPLPLPMFEIFVYSPKIEGVHLRGAKVARGGLRWSDRREDFRTEVLGLMKAQQVKNSVIVPLGAKGGFVAKQLPVNGDRESVMAEVVSCYRTFISGLLDITDNYHGDDVVPPKNVVRYDEDDPYLVVAADKGTATFSDYANELANQYGFWLGDAFASGGSAGYDHKKMGITARGAWESVKRNFREKGHNTQTTDFSVVGIGDMGGDVFGNGMLLSEHICLRGAYNHLHIFVDPNPDSASTYKERKRLFEMPRSSWADFDSKLMSKGGGIFKRTDKYIAISTQMKKVFGIEEDKLTPNDLIRAMLLSEVDLIWNGGIGTFVKSSQESHADAGDRANDTIRVDGNQLRARVVAEGGNLGLTQLGRVEYAQNGGTIYSDFVDNSAGVDCSDHEVNIKILLNRVVTDGDMTNKQRNVLLAEMTHEVGELVLDNNYQQTQAISMSTARSIENMDLYRRYIRELAKEGKLDREIEFMPSNKELLERKALKQPLTRPEMSVLLAYTRTLLKEEILASDLPEDEYFIDYLKCAFPVPLRQQYLPQMREHSLRREIIATQISNYLTNRTGTSFIYQLKKETGASVSSIVRAFIIATHSFQIEKLWDAINAMDYEVSSDVQYALTDHVYLLLRRATRWFLRNRHKDVDIQDTIKIFIKPIRDLVRILPDKLTGMMHRMYKAAVADTQKKGVPPELAEKICLCPMLHSALDVVEASALYKHPLEDVATVYYKIGSRMELNWIRWQVRGQVVDTNWDELARSCFLDDLDWQQRQLSVSILQLEPRRDDIMSQIDAWLLLNNGLVDTWERLLSELRGSDNGGFVMYSVALRELQNIVQASFQKAQIN